MPEFKKGNDWSNKFLSKSPWKKETRWTGPYKKTIAKDPTIDEELGLNKMKTTKAKKKKDWEPAFPGADHSQEELDKMTKEEKEDYYN